MAWEGGPEQRDHGGLGTPPHPRWPRPPCRLPGPLWSPSALLSAPPQSRCPRPSRAPPRPPRPPGPGPGPLQPKVTAKPALGVHQPPGGKPSARHPDIHTHTIHVATCTPGDMGR